MLPLHGQISWKGGSFGLLRRFVAPAAGSIMASRLGTSRPRFSGVAPQQRLTGEARAGESRKDFKHKLRICLKELRETLVWLKLIKQLGLLPHQDIESLLAEANELVAIFVVSVRTAEGKK